MSIVILKIKGTSGCTNLYFLSYLQTKRKKVSIMLLYNKFVATSFGLFQFTFEVEWLGRVNIKNRKHLLQPKKYA